MNFRSLKTMNMSARTPAIDFAGGASAGRGGSRKKKNVPAMRQRLTIDDITRT